MKGCSGRKREGDGKWMEGLGKAIIGGAVTEIRALPDRGSNCVVHMLWEGDILQHSFLEGMRVAELPRGLCSS